MKPSSITQSLGLLLSGFLLGIIVAGLNNSTKSYTANTPSGRVQSGTYDSLNKAFDVVAQTGIWDVLAESSGQGRQVVLGQNGQVRVVVLDDDSALYVMTYKEGDALWQGRLMDVGNDGTVEVADISYGHCEAFDPPAVAKN